MKPKAGSQQHNPLSLKSISISIKELFESKAATQSQFASIANSFIALYNQGLLRPQLGENGKIDEATKEMEKRILLFSDCLKGREKIGLEIAKHRLVCCLKGKPITQDNLNLVLKEPTARKMVVLGGLNPEGNGIGFGTLDGTLVALDIWLNKVNSSSVDQIIEILELLECLDQKVFKEKKICFLPLGRTEDEEEGNLGKRSLGTFSSLSLDKLVDECKQKVDAIVVTMLKQAKTSQADMTKIIKAISAPILSLMSNPLLVSEFAQQSLSSETEDLQDVALGLIVNLISRYSFEYPQFYEKLYNLVSKRKSYSLALLKILEISLKSRKLSVKVLASFLKVSQAYQVTSAQMLNR